MATNLDIITSALRILNVINENEAPSSDLAAVGLEAMNDMLADWNADGIELGYFPQTVLAGISPLEDQDLRGVKYNLAVEIAGHIAAPVSEATAFVAEQGYSRLSKGTTEEIVSDLDHLPKSLQAFDISIG
jgi:hypothetical protein